MDSLEVLLNVKSEGMSKVRADFEATSKVAAKTSSKIKGITKQTDALSKKTKEYAKNIQKQKDLQKQAFDIFNTESRKEQAKLKATNALLDKKNSKLKALQGTLLGLGFSMLFGGMAIRNFFGSISRGLFNTFALAEGQTSQFGVATAELQGAWAYLKYSIVDALMSTDIVWTLIDWAIAFIDWLSSIPSWAKIAFMSIVIGIWGVGTAMQILGQLIMLTVGYLAFLALKAWLAEAGLLAAFGTTMATKITLIGTAIKSVALWIWRVLIPILAWVALAAVILALGISIGLIWNNFTTALAVRFKSLGEAFTLLKIMFINGWTKIGIHAQLFALNLKLALMDAFESLSAKFANFMNGMIDGYNKMVPGFMEIKGRVSAITFDTADLVQEIADLDVALVNIDNETTSAMETYVIQQEANKAVLDENLDDAGTNLTAGWESILDSISGKVNDVQDTVGFSDSSRNETNNSSVVVNNNIEITGDAKELDSQMNKIVEDMEARYIKFGVTKTT